MGWRLSNSFRGGLRRWLGASGSLSARLARAGERFDVQVIRQGRQGLRPDEARALGLGGTRPGYVREVVLRVDGAAIVFARSVTAHAGSLGPWRSLRGLGNRPLADLLFKRSMGIARTPLEFSRMRPASRAQRHVARAWRLAGGEPLRSGALPARRSAFRRQGAALLVMEVFAAPRAPSGWSCEPAAQWRS